jgi:ribonuclease E
MPGNVARVKRYRDDVPLFSRFQIEHQIETAYSRQVTLPSGGAIVIDHTEALVAVDVNSAAPPRAATSRKPRCAPTCEAADEIARQLRLRDLGGLIVIDFIDMEKPARPARGGNPPARRACTTTAPACRWARSPASACSNCRASACARHWPRPATSPARAAAAPATSGTESAALHILRILEEEAMKENTGAVHVQVPVDVATFLLNEKRDRHPHASSCATRSISSSSRTSTWKRRRTKSSACATTS